jgi:hypothetical protein
MKDWAKPPLDHIDPHQLFACVTIPHGSMVPYIKQVLLPKKTV